MSEPLHTGKLTEECKTTVTPAMHDLLAERASKARCTPSDLLRDCLYLVISGDTYAAHVANDRLKAITGTGRTQADLAPSSGTATEYDSVQTTARSRFHAT